MKKENNSLSQEYFDNLYSANPDPWNFETSTYEREKYLKTIDSLPKNHYENVLELGCSIGVLTKLLATKCSRLLAVDISGTALATARRRLQTFKNVDFLQADISQKFPSGDYDLIVVSEVGYYLSLSDLTRAKNQIKSSLRTHGDLILVHWTHFVEDYPITGDQVHEVFLEDQELNQIMDYYTADYRLDVFTKK